MKELSSPHLFLKFEFSLSFRLLLLQFLTFHFHYLTLQILRKRIWETPKKLVLYLNLTSPRRNFGAYHLSKLATQISLCATVTSHLRRNESGAHNKIVQPWRAELVWAEAAVSLAALMRCISAGLSWQMISTQESFREVWRKKPAQLDQ